MNLRLFMGSELLRKRVPFLIHSYEHCIIMSYCGEPLANVLAMIDEWKRASLLMKVVSELISTVQCVHERDYVLLDLKPDSIVVGIEKKDGIMRAPQESDFNNNEWLDRISVHIVDFESAMHINNLQNIRRLTTTFGYTAPEALKVKESKITKKR